MIVDALAHLPAWIQSLIWSLVAVLTITLVARVVIRLICQRLRTWAENTEWRWDDLLVEALQKGMPWWSMLFGLYTAVSFWQFSEPLTQTLHQALFTAGWLSATFLLADLASRMVLLYGQHWGGAWPITSLSQNLAKLTVVSLGLLMVLHGLGIPIAPLLTALGVGGLAVALALQDTLSNLFAGFYLTLSRQVRLGDYVKLDSGQEGFIEDISWRSTQVRMLANNIIFVPNKKLSEAIIINYDRPSQDMAVLVEMGVDYRSDLAQVERVTVEVGREVMKTVIGGVPDFEPFIRLHTFGESSINFTVILRGKTFVDQYLVKHEFIKQVHTRYQQEGIAIPFPTRTVYLQPTQADGRP